MTLLSRTSPHFKHSGTTGQYMRQVIYACIPGLAVLSWFFGWGTLINVIWASLLALAFEAMVMFFRKRSVGFYLQDYSAVLTGVLIGLSIPPSSPWWLVVVGVFFAIVITKQLYGGLGANPFNPAMAGYVLLLISFPKEMTAWVAPSDLSPSGFPALLDSLGAIFNPQNFDAITMATPLDTIKTYAGNTEKLQDASVLQGTMAGFAWEWVNIAFLAGGLYLLLRRIISWHIPAAFLLGLSLMSLIYWLVNPSLYASPAFHLLSGGTMLGAFFIASDPVSAATSFKGKLIYGFLIGVLIYIIRTWGGYPDAVAFSVLLLNLAAPAIDYFSQPRTYGHDKPNKGLPDKP